MNNAKKPVVSALKKPVYLLPASSRWFAEYFDDRSEDELKRINAEAAEAIAVGRAAKELLLLGSPTFGEVLEDWLKLLGYEELGNEAIRNIVRNSGGTK